MNTNNALAVLLFSSLVGCGSSELVRGNGHLVETERSAPAFSRVAVSDELDAEISIGDPQLKLLIDDNLVALVRTDVHEGELGVHAAAGYELLPSPGALATIASPQIDALETSGSARLVGATNGANVNLTASGDSTLVASATGASVLAADASGSSHLSASGFSDRVAVEASGSSVVAIDATADSADVDASGSSNVTVHASAAVRVRASGSSIVTVVGGPRARDVETSGEARVVYAD
jgi:hypothetical protein